MLLCFGNVGQLQLTVVVLTRQWKFSIQFVCFLFVSLMSFFGNFKWKSAHNWNNKFQKTSSCFWLISWINSLLFARFDWQTTNVWLTGEIKDVCAYLTVCLIGRTAEIVWWQKNHWRPSNKYSVINKSQRTAAFEICPRRIAQVEEVETSLEFSNPRVWQCYVLVSNWTIRLYINYISKKRFY